MSDKNCSCNENNCDCGDAWSFIGSLLMVAILIVLFFIMLALVDIDHTIQDNGVYSIVTNFNVWYP